MSTTASRSVTVGFTSASDGIDYEQTFEAVDSATGPADNKSVSLTTGANTIAIPVGSKAITIIPLSNNTVQLTLKGVSGDTGIALNLTDPTSVGIESVTQIVINAASAVTVRIIIS